MDFFDIVEPHLKELTENEHHLFEFVVQNMEKINGVDYRMKLATQLVVNKKRHSA